LLYFQVNPSKVLETFSPNILQSCNLRRTCVFAASVSKWKTHPQTRLSTFSFSFLRIRLPISNCFRPNWMDKMPLFWWGAGETQIPLSPFLSFSHYFSLWFFSLSPLYYLFISLSLCHTFPSLLPLTLLLLKLQRGKWTQYLSKEEKATRRQTDK